MVYSSVRGDGKSIRYSFELGKYWRRTAGGDDPSPFSLEAVQWCAQAVVLAALFLGVGAHARYHFLRGGYAIDESIALALRENVFAFLQLELMYCVVEVLVLARPWLTPLGNHV